MVTPNLSPAQAPSPTGLTIGDLAQRTGVAAATLRMWETRHGFPRPTRLESGHRRYDERDVEAVRQVVLRRDAGTRLEVAIAGVALARAGDQDPPPAPSIFAAVRRRQPALQPQRLKKTTLLALSWAIEDECIAKAERPVIFGGFQQERYYRASRSRWRELARVARATYVMAAFDDGPPTPPEGDRTVFVDLPEDAPMRREWAVVCDAPDHTAMLTAWELPGQSTLAEDRRLFEAVWTVDPVAVRDAARACAQVALQLGHGEAGPLLYELADDPPPTPVELVDAASMLNRVVAYVDRAADRTAGPG